MEEVGNDLRILILYDLYFGLIEDDMVILIDIKVFIFKLFYEYIYDFLWKFVCK